MKLSHRPAQIFSSVLAASALLGCTGDPGVGDRTAALGECDEGGWECSSNSPEIDHYGFHDLNLFGLPNSANITIEVINGRAQIVKDGISYDLMVKESRIMGARKGVPVLMGQDLQRAEIRLVLNGAPDYVIRIESVRATVFPYGDPDPLEAYTLSWYGPKLAPDSKRNVCRAVSSATSAPAAKRALPPRLDPDLLNLDKLESVVFEGDRYDAQNKTTEPNFDDSWFNIGCAGHTLAKLQLMRHTLAASAPHYDISHEDRQATLKLLTADYCGTGRPFTIAGVKLVWQGDLMSFRSTPWKIEARWSSKGATCLTLPRLWSQDPDIVNQIASECSIPACDDEDPYKYNGASRVSALVP